LIKKKAYYYQKIAFHNKMLVFLIDIRK